MRVDEMKRILVSFLLGLGILIMNGCTSLTAPIQPPQGLLFTMYKAPLSTDYDETEVSPRKGTASTFYFRDILLTGLTFGWDNAGIDDAARNGELTKVDYADYEILSILGIFGKFTVTAHGS